MDGAAVADVDQDLAGEKLLGEVGVEVPVDGDHDDVGGADGLVVVGGPEHVGDLVTSRVVTESGIIFVSST